MLIMLLSFLSTCTIPLVCLCIYVPAILALRYPLATPPPPPPPNGCETKSLRKMKIISSNDYAERKCYLPSPAVCNKWIHEGGQEFRRRCGLTPDEESYGYVV